MCGAHICLFWNIIWIKDVQYEAPASRIVSRIVSTCVLFDRCCRLLEISSRNNVLQWARTPQKSRRPGSFLQCFRLWAHWLLVAVAACAQALESCWVMSWSKHQRSLLKKWINPSHSFGCVFGRVTMITRGSHWEVVTEDAFHVLVWWTCEEVHEASLFTLSAKVKENPKLIWLLTKLCHLAPPPLKGGGAKWQSFVKLNRCSFCFPRRHKLHRHHSLLSMCGAPCRASAGPTTILRVDGQHTSLLGC